MRLTPLDSDQQTRAASCHRLAIKLGNDFARSFRPFRPDRIAADFADAALDGLMRAAASYDPALSPQFSTWAHLCITCALKDLMRRLAKERRNDRLCSFPEWDGQDLPPPVDRAPSVERVFELRDELAWEIRRLPPTLRRTVQALADGLSEPEVADAEGVAVKSIHTRINRVRNLRLARCG